MNYKIFTACIIILLILPLIACDSTPNIDYPADISAKANVVSSIYVNLVKGTKQSIMQPKADNVFWVANITVKNNSYLKNVLGNYNHWFVEFNGNIFSSVFRAIWDGESSGMDLKIGQSGSMMNCFEVPNDVYYRNTELIYKGQEPYSYGEINIGDKFDTYDFDRNKLINFKYDIAIVQRFIVGNIPYKIYVYLKPTDEVIVNEVYRVELYEKGKLRDASQIVSWSQPELNVKKEKMVGFDATREEFRAYQLEDISHIFSVKVHN